MTDAEIVELYFKECRDDDGMREMIEQELGWPIRVKIDAKNRVAVIRGTKRGKEFDFDLIVASYHKRLNQ